MFAYCENRTCIRCKRISRSPSLQTRAIGFVIKAASILLIVNEIVSNGLTPAIEFDLITSLVIGGLGIGTGFLGIAISIGFESFKESQTYKILRKEYIQMRSK